MDHDTTQNLNRLIGSFYLAHIRLKNSNIQSQKELNEQLTSKI